MIKTLIIIGTERQIKHVVNSARMIKIQCVEVGTDREKVLNGLYNLMMTITEKENDRQLAVSYLEGVLDILAPKENE